MARTVHDRDTTSTLNAAQNWISTCLVGDGSIFSSNRLWTLSAITEVYHAFIDNPDSGDDDFLTKLKRQIGRASAPAQQLAAEALWILLLFPANVKPRTKRLQVCDVWALSGHALNENHTFLSDAVLQGIGSGGPGFNNHRPREFGFILALFQSIKSKPLKERENIFSDYNEFVEWIDTVPRSGNRQFRHMLRYFAFPDRVERISSNNDRIRILTLLGEIPSDDIRDWSDHQLDEALLALRERLAITLPPGGMIDFYQPSLVGRWTQHTTVKTQDGEVAVVIPIKEDENDDTEEVQEAGSTSEARRSFQIQAKLTEIGAILGLKVWLPPSDRGRVVNLVDEKFREAVLRELPLNYENNTLQTIQQIDVLWIKGRAIVRAFEVEHTTAIYSGLLRMADLLALQPNMSIRLHIVAPEERKDKVLTEMQRPVFTLWDRGPLSNSCSYISYDTVEYIHGMKHLNRMNDEIIQDFEEKVPITPVHNPG